MRTDDLARVGRRYRRFADEEARGVSLRYAAWAEAVGRDRPTLEWLARLPPAKRQPNLLFAAVRHLYGDPGDGDQFLTLLGTHREAVAGTMLARSTQTNEPGRCAVLLPVLARLPPPLALIEVGASAGLCLLLDRYGYRYGDRVLPAAGAGPVLECAADAATPLPEAVPEVAWRVGVDLAPIDLEDPDAVAWLETLVWPEHEHRRDRLRAAVAVARADPPEVRHRDLRQPLDDLVAEAPAGATVVVMHSAALAYVPSRDDVDRFVDHVRGLPVTWISNESPNVLPELAGAVDRDARRGRFLMAVDGHPVAWTGPHGQSIDWIEDRR